MSISPDRILFQDEHFLAVNKLSGELVVGGKGRPGMETAKAPLLDFLKKDFPGLRPVNRLDFETSGVVLFARSKKALEFGMEMKTKKMYRMIVKGRLERPTGAIRFPLPARSGKGTVEAETLYKVVERFHDCMLVEATIETGRHHQIRKHFAKIEHPLALDEVYGDKKFNRKFGKAVRYHRFFLHAAKLEFMHPFTNQKVSIEAEVPRAFGEAMKKLAS